MSRLDENLKFIQIADCRQSAALKVAEFLSTQGRLPLSDLALQALASCFEWAYSTQARAREAEARATTGKSWQSPRDRCKARVAYTIKMLRVVAPIVALSHLRLVAESPVKFTGAGLGLALHFSKADYEAMGGVGSIRPYDATDEEYDLLEKARRARERAIRRANRSPEEIEADRLAARLRYTRRGREGEGSKLIAAACGVTEQSVRNWKRHPKGLWWNVERVIGRRRSSLLLKHMNAHGFGNFTSLENDRSGDTKIPKNRTRPGRASSPSRSTSHTSGDTQQTCSNLIDSATVPVD